MNLRILPEVADDIVQAAQWYRNQYPKLGIEYVEESYLFFGEILATPENPYAMSFDPSYVYAPSQGIRFFGGFRFNLK